MNKLFYILILVFVAQFSFAQCNLEIAYDEAGNRIFRGNPCNPECSTHVITTADVGKGSLREAIYCAQDGDNITFESTLDNQFINMVAGKLLIDKSIGINKDDNGYTPIRVKLMSTINDIVIEVEPSHTVWLNKMDLTSHEGFNNNPRILDNQGNLTLQNVNLYDDGAFANQNSALLNTGALTILELVNLFYVYYQ